MLLRYHYDVKMICLIFFNGFKFSLIILFCEFDLKVYTIEHMVCCLLVSRFGCCCCFFHLHCLVFKQIEKSTPCYPQQFQFLPFQGCVNLTAPDDLFALLLDYGDDPNEAPPSPQRLFFGRLVRIQKSSL